MLLDYLDKKKISCPINLKELGCDKLTPIHDSNGYLFKRDDLFEPFEDLPLNGGKVRQCLKLIHGNYDYIVKHCNSKIATASSVFSPQSIIVTRVAHEFGFKSLIAVGGQKNILDSIKKHSMLSLCNIYQAKIINVSSFGYNNAIYSELNKTIRTNKHFIVNFGMKSKLNKKFVLRPIEDQVSNLPDEINNLIVPVGSAISFSAILRGIKRYEKKVNKIIGIQIANIDRSSVVKGLVQGIKYVLIRDPTYKYHTHVDLSLDRMSLDPIYEAKAFAYAEKMKYIKQDNNDLFWIVGNTIQIRGLKL